MLSISLNTGKLVPDLTENLSILVELENGQSDDREEKLGSSRPEFILVDDSSWLETTISCSVL